MMVNWKAGQNALRQPIRDCPVKVKFTTPATDSALHVYKRVRSRAIPAQVASPATSDLTRQGAPRTKPTIQMTSSTRISACDL
jgi:hypothetical protein